MRCAVYKNTYILRGKHFVKQKLPETGKNFLTHIDITNYRNVENKASQSHS